MNGCRDKRFKDLLHAYELGMLTEEERRELEVHLLECEDCLNEAKQFNKTIRLIREDSEVRETVKKIAEKKIEVTSSEKLKWFAGRRLVRSLIPATVIAAIVLLLILQPWQIEFRPTQEAVAAKNRLAIMYFDNLADPENNPKLGEIAANLLITDLSESQYVSVISGQRLYDVLKFLGKEGEKRIDRDIASQVAIHTEADWILLGSILQIKPNIILTTQLINTESDQVEASQRITGSPGEDIFALIDKLTVKIKVDLTLPDDAWMELDRLVSEVTTHSPEAYRYYLEGIDLYYKHYYPAADTVFKKALDYDSTFAMAYYYLTWVADSLSQMKNMIAKAVQYIDNAGQRDKYYIRSRDAAIKRNDTLAINELQKLLEMYPEEKVAHYILGNYRYNQRLYEKAAIHYSAAIEIDPLYKVAYNLQAYNYDKLGDFEKAITSINKYIELVPDEPNPYDSRGEIYARNGKFRQAIESYERALEIKPDFYNSMWKLGFLNMLTNNYQRSEYYYKKLYAAADESNRTDVRYYLALIPARQGKFTEAIQLIDKNIADERKIHGVEGEFFHRSKSYIYEELNNLDLALVEFDSAVTLRRLSHPEDAIFFRTQLVRLLAKMNQYERAEIEAENLKKDCEEKNIYPEADWVSQGGIAFEKGDMEMAIYYLEKSMAEYPDFPTKFLLARAFLESGRLADAVNTFEELQLSFLPWRSSLSIWDTKTHYYLGIAYEESRWYDKAIEQYETFLEILKDADPGWDVIEDARKRLARLKSK